MKEKTASKITSDKKLKTAQVKLDISGSKQDFLGGGVEGEVYRTAVNLKGRPIPQGLAYKEYGYGATEIRFL